MIDGDIIGEVVGGLLELGATDNNPKRGCAIVAIILSLIIITTIVAVYYFTQN